MATASCQHSRPALYSALCCLLLILSARQLAAQRPATPVPSPTQATSTLKVRVTAIRNAKGKIRITLYHDSKAVDTRLADIEPQSLKADAIFEKLPQGAYSVFLFHDENMNGKMDANFMGIPTEGYGSSNNPKKRMGPPKPDETIFQISEPECAIEINLIYW
ncbi:MAG: DUF2141 domain-containing protein [Terracidiphilus sp.]